MRCQSTPESLSNMLYDCSDVAVDGSRTCMVFCSGISAGMINCNATNGWDSFTCPSVYLTRSCGDNSDGQLGLGLTISSLNDAQGIVDKEFVSIQAVGAGGTALTKDNKVYGWGRMGSYSNSPILLLSPTEPVTKLVCGYSACGFITNGEVYTWGYNNHGQLMDGTKTETTAPSKALLLNHPTTGVAPVVVDLFTSTNSFYMKADDNRILCSGASGSGQCDGGVTTSADTYQRWWSTSFIPDEITSLEGKHYNFLAITASKNVYSLGSNYDGGMCQLAGSSATTPYQVTHSDIDGHAISAVSGRYNSGIVTDTGKVFTCGIGGGLGTGLGSADSSEPVDVTSAFPEVITTVSGSEHYKTASLFHGANTDVYVVDSLTKICKTSFTLGVPQVVLENFKKRPIVEARVGTAFAIAIFEDN
eukprot:TRINITY_DN4870_c0_g1_i2.p1 TRINITY_DN4870_c0_g1~~TRINITY_DN4870_c0_g1_i2.p1  ORF type:complete len:418 (-),score=43.80 TRINITY_DN4870_c0_g1_i2:60-1313(-)